MRNILCRGISLVECDGRQVRLVEEMEENCSHTWKEVVWEDIGGRVCPLLASAWLFPERVGVGLDLCWALSEEMFARPFSF